MSIANELQTLTTNVQGVLDGKACIAQAITSKGVATADDASFDTMAVNVGLIEGGGEGGEKFPYSSVINIAPNFDESWTLSEFTLSEDQSGTGFNVPNPIGVVPTAYVALRKDFGLSEISGTSEKTVLFGAYNVGNSVEDNNNNRTIIVSNMGSVGVLPITAMFVPTLQASNWNAVNSGSGVATAQYIKFRAGGNANTLWPAGTYLLAVK